MSYSNEELISIYELGRMYLEMGYYTPAERIFNGLCVVDSGTTPGRVSLGVIKLERGLFEESAQHFKRALQEGYYPLQAKLGLSVAFIGQGDISRAKSVLVQVASELEKSNGTPAELRTLWEALALRCEGG